MKGIEQMRMNKHSKIGIMAIVCLSCGVTLNTLAETTNTASTETATTTTSSTGTGQTSEASTTSTTANTSSATSSITSATDTSSTSSTTSTTTSTTTETTSTNEEAPITEESQHAMGGKTLASKLLKSRSVLATQTSGLSAADTSLPRKDFIDVSSWNEEITVASYKKMMAYGVTGVVVKLTEGTSYKNPLAKSQIANAQKAGLKVSTYHFARYSTSAEAKKEAAYYAAYAKTLGLSTGTTMVNDVESDEVKANATALSKTFAAALASAGYANVLHYSSASWFTGGTLAISSLGGTTKGWVAHYLDSPQASNLLYTQYSAWQWASDLYFPTVDAPISFDISIDYTGKLSNYSDAKAMKIRSGDQVFQGDWNGDGVDTFAIRRGNTFYVKNSLTGGQADQIFSLGNSSDEVYVGDWNGDGSDSFSLRRGNTFYIKNDFSGGSASASFQLGNLSDRVLVGDWDGDGKDSFGLQRRDTFYFKNGFVGGTANTSFKFGNVGDTGMVGDWNGDGKDTVVLRRNNQFYFKNSLKGGQADFNFAFGKPSDEAYTGKWSSTTKDGIIVRRGNTFYVKTNLTNNTAESNFSFGNLGDKVLIGDYANNGKETVAVLRGNVFYGKTTLSGGSANFTIIY